MSYSKIIQNLLLVVAFVLYKVNGLIHQYEWFYEGKEFSDMDLPNFPKIKFEFENCISKK